MLEDRVPDDLEFHVSDAEEAEPESEDELILTPSPEEEEPESEELTLEAEKVYKISEITFDGEDESENRIEKAMEEYDAAMDSAAGLKK